MSYLCQNQDTFNNAFRGAVKYIRKQREPKTQVQIVAIFIWTIFILWALLLAAKIPSGYRQTEHLLLAMIFSPFYIISYYLGRY